MFVGIKPSPALSYPSLGSIISHELGGQNNIPPYISVPNSVSPFAGSGFLSNRFGSFDLGSDPASNDFQVRDLNIPVEQERYNRRRNLLEITDSSFKNTENDDNISAMDDFYDQAFNLISSQKAKDAFDLNKESDKTRDFYGRGQAGSRLLMARRLIEAGCRIVNTHFGSWDLHDNIKNGFERQAPELDKALHALISDLKESGLLDETLFVIVSEFGRTPKLNPQNGRDHLSKVFSTYIAGAGVKEGVYGASSELADEVEKNPVSPTDLFSTIFHLMGVDSKRELMAAGSRPVQISKGKIISEII